MLVSNVVAKYMASTPAAAVNDGRAHQVEVVRAEMSASTKPTSPLGRTEPPISQCRGNNPQPVDKAKPQRQTAADAIAQALYIAEERTHFQPKARRRGLAAGKR